MKSIEVKGTARTIAERSSEQARALKAIRKGGFPPHVKNDRCPHPGHRRRKCAQRPGGSVCGKSQELF